MSEPLDPISGGAWLRDATGALLPADEATALRAGLSWPLDAAPATPDATDATDTKE